MYLIERCYQHFIYVHYGCGKQSKVDYSTASTMTSWHHFQLTDTQNCQNLTQLCQCNVHLHAYVPHLSVLKHFTYVNYRSGKTKRRSTASTMTSWHHFYLTVTQNCQNLTQLKWCHGVKVQLYAYIPNWKVNNTSYVFDMDVWSNQRWSTASTMTSWHHFYSTVTKSCQNLTQLWQHYGINLYAYVPHWNVLQHFIHVHYGCVKESKVVYSLNHDIMTSFPLDSHPELPKSDPASSV